MRHVIALVLLPLHLLAQHTAHDPEVFADGFDDVPLVIETPEQLRDLAEIDGDPQTFTADEQMKFEILGQLLGIDANLPVTE